MTSKLIPWPGMNEEGLAKPASFEDLVDPILDTLHAYYNFTPKDPDALPVFEGMDHAEGHICFPIHEALSPKGLAYNRERDRDVLAIMLIHAVQLGIEQGRRLAAERTPYSLWKIAYEAEELRRTGLIRGRKPEDILKDMGS